MLEKCYTRQANIPGITKEALEPELDVICTVGKEDGE
jgi:hypothetical protein